MGYGGSFGEYLIVLNERIEELDSLIRDARMEKRKYLKACRMDGGLPESALQDIKVMGGSLRLSFADAVQRMGECDIAINKLLKEREDLCKKREKLICFCKNKQGKEAQIFFYRNVRGYTQEMTARVMGYSLRQIQRIEREMKRQEGE